MCYKNFCFKNIVTPCLLGRCFHQSQPPTSLDEGQDRVLLTLSLPKVGRGDADTVAAIPTVVDVFTKKKGEGEVEKTRFSFHALRQECLNTTYVG